MHGTVTDDSDSRPEPDYRFTLANERTFLAWQRTALGLLAAGVAVVQLAPELVFPGVRHVLGALLAGLAIMTSAMGLRRWEAVTRAICDDAPLPRHRTPTYLALGLVAIGVIALVLVVIGAFRL